MSAAVMSNFFFPPVDQAQAYVADSQLRVQHWMLAQMAQYPPPPQAEPQHYNALYPMPPGQQQLLDPTDQQVQFSSINQPLYPKVESPTSEQASVNRHIQNLAHDLQQQTSLEDQQRQQLAQAAQHVQQDTPRVAPSAPPLTNTFQSAPDQSAKPNRLRKACDSCSIRKVKCDEAGPPCRACSALDIPCTFERPSRRRGPPNRHAEAIKRRKLEGANGDTSRLSSMSAPSSPTHAAPVLAGLPSDAADRPPSAEMICPLDLLDLLIDDFFTYIHPLCPFPHEPSFRDSWKERKDLSDRSFLALLASMIGALVASYPRRPRLHLKVQNRETLFPNHMSFVDRCQRVCSLARGVGYLGNEDLSVYDAATSYFTGLANFYTYRWRQGRLYLGECLTIIRTLGLHKGDPRGHSTKPLFGSTRTRKADEESAPPADNVIRELGRRLFWTVFATVKSMQQQGAATGELVIPPPTSADPHPPLPTEVDDFCIYRDHTEPQPPNIVPSITGFIANVSVYSSYQPLSTMELAWGIDSIIDWSRQKRVLYESLRRCKDSVDQLPDELAIGRQGRSADKVSHRTDSNGHETSNGGQINDPTTTLLSHIQPSDNHLLAESQRREQREIQKANIYASALSTRSYIVEKYWNLCEAHERLVSPKPSSPSSGITATGLDGLLFHPTSHPDLVESEMRSEQESIMKDLLLVLGSIDVVHMEPNADSFTSKIRSIASTLLDAPDYRKGQLASEAQEYLSAFLKILARLERVSTPANSERDHEEDDETGLRAWSDLREYQQKFAQRGGVLTL